jgi:putative membrane protein
VRVISGLIGAALALVIVAFAISNRAGVELSFWPLPYVASLPTYLLVLVPLVVGFLLGGFGAWASAFRWRRQARRAEAKQKELESELASARASNLPVAPSATP